MMYCTVDDLQKQVNQDVLERVAGDEDGNLLPDVIDYGIEQASAEIDAYCSRYSLPFATVPEVLKKYLETLKTSDALISFLSLHAFKMEPTK